MESAGPAEEMLEKARRWLATAVVKRSNLEKKLFAEAKAIDYLERPGASSQKR